MDLIGQVKGAKQKPEEVHYVKDPLNYQWVDVDYMVALATGPRTKDGLKRLVESKIKHGRFTKAEREKAKQISEKRRKIQNELKELESWFVDYGHLEKNWRKDWGKL